MVSLVTNNLELVGGEGIEHLIIADCDEVSVEMSVDSFALNEFKAKAIIWLAISTIV